MKRYDKYKPSGIDWIGDIPEHWTIATVGRVTNLGRGRVISNLEIGENPGEYPVYSSQTENNGVMGHLATYDFDGEYVTWTTDGANAGTVFHRTGKFNCTNVCGTIQPKNWEQLDLRFLPYYLNLGTKYSVRLDINPKLMNNMMAKIPLILPSIEEQSNISDFLKNKFDSIDTLIASKIKQRQLLLEEREAIRNSYLYNSGAKYIKKKLKYLAKMQGGYAFDSTDFVPEGVQLIRIGNLYQNELSLDRQPVYLPNDFLERFEKWIVKDGDILMSMTGTLGKRDYGYAIQIKNTNTSYLLNQRVSKIVFNESQILKDFGLMILLSQNYLDNLFLLPSGTKQGNFSNEQVLSIEVMYPEDLNIQREIIEKIAKETTAINTTIETIKNQIELINEYKISLQYEVITGKIKVI